MPLLNRRKQQIWCFFAFVRTILLVTTAIKWPPPAIAASGFDCAMIELLNEYIAPTTGPPCPIVAHYHTYYIVYIASVTTLLMAIMRITKPAPTWMWRHRGVHFHMRRVQVPDKLPLRVQVPDTLPLPVD